MPEVMIRPFRMEETETVIGIWRECGLAQWDRRPEETIRVKMAHSPDQFLVGVLAGAVVATTIFGYDGLRGWLYRVAVLPSAQRQGIGCAMVAEAEARLRALGCVRVKLQLESRSADAAGFYERQGFRRQPLVSMSKWLDGEARA